jgi:hypothetical protein
MKKNLLFIAFLTIFVSACIREIDFLAPTEIEDTLVVDASFTDRNGPHRVYLTRPNKYDVTVFEHLQAKEVWIKDDLGNISQLTEKRTVEHPFYYELVDGVFKGVNGRLYHLEIKMKDGKEYQSVPQMMPKSVKIDSIKAIGREATLVSSVDLVVKQKKAIISSTLTMPTDGKDYFFKFDAHSVYVFFELTGFSPINLSTKTCYVLDEFNKQKIVLQQKGKANGSIVRTEIGEKNLDQSFYNSQYITLVQRSITREAYQYWEKIQQISAPTGTIFDAPPGVVFGNIYNINDSTEKVLGFFEVASVDTLRHKIVKGDLGPDFIVGKSCNEANIYYSPLPECYDCLLLKNSTREVPWYWEF